MTMHKTNPYTLSGERAFAAGIPLKNNPLAPRSEAARAWAQGWKAAQRKSAQ